MKTLNRIMFALVLAIVAIPVIYTVSIMITKRKYEKGYAKIHVGDSKQKVTELLGEPGDIEVCYKGDNCHYKQVYYSVIEKWVVVFDGDNNVVDTYYNVSP